jgi:nitrous oxidase accessory protein NosD
MRKFVFRSAVVGLSGAAMAVSGLAAGAAQAASAWGQPGGGPVFVSPSGVATASGQSCTSAAYSSIQAAIDAAPIHGEVVVCAGTYDQTATVTKSLTLQGRPGAIVDATGNIYGIGATASWVTIAGLTVENADSTAPEAPDDGIITAGLLNGQQVAADHVTVTNDITEDNVGSGIDLNSTSYSSAIDDRSSGNGVGINVSDDLGSTASYNTIRGNVSNDNPGGCGIVLADHSGAGIFDNTITDNVANDNGLGTPSAPDASTGSGIILAGSAGGVYDNWITWNTFDGNGHAGAVLHAHVPGLNFGGNVLAWNKIGVNNLRTDYADNDTTGIYLGDASPLTVTVIGNVIQGDYYGIFTAGSVTVTGETHNWFAHVLAAFGNTPTYSG